MQKYLYSSLIAVLLAIVGLIGHIYFNQEHMLFRQRALPDDYIYNWKYAFEEHLFNIDSETKLSALLFKTENPKGTVVYFHGRGGNLGSDWGHIAKDFLSRDYNLFMYDYRGYGKSRGKLSEAAFLKDASIMYEYLADRFDEKDLILYGKSLGTGVATYIASQYHPKMLILDSPYYSIWDIAPQSIPFLPARVTRMLLRYPLRTDLWIQDVTSRIHIFHGTHDTLIPYTSSTRLMDLLSDEMYAELTTIEQGTHSFIDKHPDYQKELTKILQ